MLRDLCTALGAVCLSGFLLIVLMILVGAILQSIRRQRDHVHLCSHHETIDAKGAYLGYRCTVCQRRRELGVTLHIGTNRRTRRA